MKLGDWNKTRELLRKSAEYFSVSEKKNQKFKDYQIYLKEDEFELALESIEELLYEIENHKDEFWILNYLRTTCENMCLTDKEQYFREAITQILLKNRELIKIDKPDLIGEVKYLSWFENGRISPITSGYRAQFKYDNLGEWSALQQLIDKEVCFPNETVRINFKFYVDNAHKRKLYKNQQFEIREGSRIVAIGTIIDIPREEFIKID
jgi:ribosomal protein L16 Arg81 hydroxylase